MMLADIHGHVQRTWKASHVHDLAVSTDGQLLFCVTSEHKVRLNNPSTTSLAVSVQSGAYTCFRCHPSHQQWGHILRLFHHAQCMSVLEPDRVWTALFSTVLQQSYSRLPQH